MRSDIEFWFLRNMPVHLVMLVPILYYYLSSWYCSSGRVQLTA